jgi:membrane-bound serine protease (ClpP class)
MKIISGIPMNMQQIDPNLIYLILIVGLWLSVIAVHMPGTGVAEVLAVLGIGGSLVALANSPTNWGALVLIVIGVLSFLVMPFLDRRLLLLAIGGLALQAVGSLTLFRGTSVSPALIAMTIAASLIYYRFALVRIFNYRHISPARLEDQPIVGEEGYVKRALDPVGTVYVRGETWTARSDQALEAGTRIAVVEQSGLTLYVEALKQKRQPEEA